MWHFLLYTDDKESYKDYYNVLAKCMETFTENGDIQLICCGAIVYIADKDGKVFVFTYMHIH